MYMSDFVKTGSKFYKIFLHIKSASERSSYSYSLTAAV